jgi:hypothetical protein
MDLSSAIFTLLHANESSDGRPADIAETYVRRRPLVPGMPARGSEEYA